MYNNNTQFDANAYQSIWQAALGILSQSKMQMGEQFCNWFLANHDPSNGQAVQNNVLALFNYVVRAAQSVGTNMSLSDEQLWRTVGEYINAVARTVSQQQPQQQQQFRGGFNGGNRFGSSGTSFGRSTGFGGSQGFGGSSPLTGAGSHLSNDDSNRGLAPQPAPPPASKPAAPTPTVDTAAFSPNPADTVPDTGATWATVTAKTLWGEDRARDRRIVIGKREDLKSDPNYPVINYPRAFHQQILNSPFDVAKDFLAVAPNSLFSGLFMFRVLYNHLTVVDVPTDYFVDIRNQCIEAVAQDPNVLLHKKVLEALDTMQRGHWKAITTYLTQHINRALLHHFRLSKYPKAYVGISSFEDLDELLSSSYSHPVLTVYPEGRRNLERVVAVAILNAMVLNTDVMFRSGELPTNAILSSPAFPFSMGQVYPNKYTIPLETESQTEGFMERLRTHELSRKSYLLSRRLVTLTNILGKKILPNLDPKVPTLFNNSVASLLIHSLESMTRVKIDTEELTKATVRPFAPEGNPGDLLEKFYEDPEKDYVEEISQFGRKRYPSLPVDHTVFAMQYGVSPQDYLSSVDIFFPMDDIAREQIMLAKGHVRVLNPSDV